MRVETRRGHARPPASHDSRPRWPWLALWLLGLGCAPKTGWERTDRRACPPDAPATLCIDASPDRPLKVRVGGATLVAGECVVAPRPDAAGRLLVVTVEGDGRTHQHRVKVARSAITRVAVDADGRFDVVARDACDATVPAP